jgi:hypothetical protein
MQYYSRSCVGCCLGYMMSTTTQISSVCFYQHGEWRPFCQLDRPNLTGGLLMSRVDCSGINPSI